MTSWIEEILAPELTAATWQEAAIAAALSDTSRAEAFGITLNNVVEVVTTRAKLLQAVYPDFCQFCHTNLNLPPQQLWEPLWNLWLPLAIQIASKYQQLHRPFIQGILGGQGTGKTTLSAMLTLIHQHLGYRTISISLDDLYKTYSDRRAVQQQDPRLIWRGPPGTHDIHLGLTVLDNLRHSQTPVSIPRFDKSAYNGAGDRTTPEIVQGVDIVLFEGWFVGARPIDEVIFESPPLPIITYADKAFARDINHQLRDYLPLWERLDSLIVLHLKDYHQSIAWRQQAEQQMIATGKSGMKDTEIKTFVEYFWRSLHPELFITPLTKSPQWVDLVVEINANHTPGAVYRPIHD
ncbi:MAG: glycerate kinase [Nostocaceae cyanobacterium]|nr:glycerate kinase [Nostocaceae cyanobacterium]